MESDDLRYRSDGPMCPYCGYVERDHEPHHFDEDWNDYCCNSCGKDYHVHVHHMGFRWSTAKIEAAARSTPGGK